MLAAQPLCRFDQTHQQTQSALHADALVEAVGVHSHGPLRQAKSSGDGFVGASAADPPGHLTLSLGQPEMASKPMPLGLAEQVGEERHSESRFAKHQGTPATEWSLRT